MDRTEKQVLGISFRWALLKLSAWSALVEVKWILGTKHTWPWTELYCLYKGVAEKLQKSTQLIAYIFAVPFAPKRKIHNSVSMIFKFHF